MTMLTDDNGINEKRFRSVLPHEPLPIDGDSKGYVHLQGAFEPKRNKLTNDSDKKSSTTTTSSSSSSSLLSYWKSPEALEGALLVALRDDYERLKLLYPVLSVHVTDPNNLSKVRLQYNSPHEAIQIQYAFRDQRISPNDIIIIITDEQEQQKSVLFGSRPCQATMITDKPLPTDRCFWPRSNPPQFRRLLHDRGDDEKERSETRFVYVTGLIDNNITTTTPTESSSDWWNNPYDVYQAMRQVFGTDVEIFLPKKQNKQQQRIQSCQLGFRSAEEAQNIVQKFQGVIVSWELNNNNKLNSGELFLDYATVTKKSKAKQQGEYEKGEASRPDCTSTTDHVHIPGLVVVENFLNEAEEELLVAILTGPQAPWAPQQSNMSQTGSVKRRVQHYGYVFDYKTADVLRRGAEEESGKLDPDANCPPLPSINNDNTCDSNSSMDNDLLVKEGKGWDLLAQIIEKTRQHEFDICPNESNNNLNNIENADQIDPNPTKKMMFSDLNQMTLNQYKTGEGIGSHVDTPSAFGDGLISISLNSGIVMEFQKVAAGNDDDDGNKLSPKNIKKLVYLPRRSLVLMSGACRYEWEHQIVTRRTDTHNGVVIPRGLRVSLTLRTALSLKGTPLPRFESNMFPPVWGIDDEKRNGSTMDSNALVTPNTERDHVHAVYDAIATQWHHTRGKRGVLWPSASQFVKDLPEGSIVADCGCGDGKYFPAVWEAGSYVIGTDISLPLLKTALLNDSSSLSDGEKVPDTRRVSPHRQALQNRPAVAVADCMSIPFRNNSCDAAICIAVMHHLSTADRRIRCIEELARIVKVNGKIMIQAWAMGCHSRRRFAAPDVFVPFNAQPKYLDKVSENSKATMQDSKPETIPTVNGPSKSAAEIYSDAYDNADFDEQKGLVVFQRYCHMYREGELEDIASQVPSVRLIDGGFESGNYFVILEVLAN
jgi:alkylated DNA repair dioxygenase AlkB/SAM-dependent methyltransferase